MSYDPLMDEGPSAPETTWALNKDGELKRWVVAEVPVFKDMCHVPVWKRTMQVLVKTVGWLVLIPAVIGVLYVRVLVGGAGLVDCLHRTRRDDDRSNA